MYTPRTMRTFTGRILDPEKMDQFDINIIDIAHALSLSCRYGGHTYDFYSIAQHCVLMSELVPEEYAFEALMHDASEAYLTDIPRAIKNLLPDYQKMEEKWEKRIAEQFELPFPITPLVKEMDRAIAAVEMACLMGCFEHPLKDQAPKIKIESWSPNVAYRKFMNRYMELAG